MTPVELAALRARFPVLAGMGAPAAADYMARRFPVGQTPEQFAPTRGATFTPQQQGAIDAAEARRSAGEWQGADVAQGPGKAIEVQLPDGTIIEFPAGTDEATMRAAVSRHLAGQPAWQTAPEVAPAWESAPQLPLPRLPSAPDSEPALSGPRPVSEIRATVLNALGKAEAATATEKRSQELAARIAAAKAGTLTVSPENAARAAEADAIALGEMGPEQGAVESGQLPLLLEAERRGILPADKQAMLDEARRRGLVPPATTAAPSAPAASGSETAESLMMQARELAAAGRTDEAKRVAQRALELKKAENAEGPTVDASSAPQGVAGQFTVMTLPDGRKVRFPAGMTRAEMADALNKLPGAKPSSDILGDDGLTVAQLYALADAQDRSGRTAAAEATRAKAAALAEKTEGLQTPGMVGGMSGAISDGVLFGFGDEYMAGLSAVLGVQPDGQGGANWFDYSKPMGERYSTALDALRVEQEAFRQAEPVAAIGGEVLGSLLGPVKGAGGFINAGTSTGARIGRGALAGGAAAAAYGFGEGEGGLEERATSSALAAPAGMLAGGVLTGAGQAFNALRKAVSRNPALREAMPTLEGLRETASGLYAKAREMGGELTEGQVSAMTKGISARINEAGFDRQLHPRVAAVVDRLTSDTGPKSLQEMEILRRVASNAAASLQPDERRIASQIIDAIDDAVDDMGGGSAALGAARETWSRLRRMETIDEAITKAGLTDDFAAGLRNQFKILLRNPRRLRGFSEAQKAAIRAVAMGGPVTNSLRQLGKLLSPTGISGAALTGGAAFSGAGVGSLAIPAAGAGMTAIANALTKSRANKALGIAGMDDATRKVIEALSSRPNVAAKAPAVPGLLGYYLSNQ